MIDIETIKHIAKLSRLTLTEKEEVLFSKQLNEIFNYVELLSEVDTDGVEETTQVTGLKNVVAEDIAIEIDEHTKEKLREQFSSRDGDYLRVQKVFDN